MRDLAGSSRRAGQTTIALTLYDLHDFELAHPMFENATTLYERFFGEQHVNTAIGYARVGDSAARSDRDGSRHPFARPETCGPGG